MFLKPFKALIRFTSTLDSFPQTFLPVHWVAWEASICPIRAIANASDEHERSELITKWMGVVLSQLTNVELIVSLFKLLQPYQFKNAQGAILSAVIVGTFSWPSLSSTLPVALAIIRFLWYSSLVFSIAAVVVAIHHSVLFSRISIIPRASEVMLELLCYETEGERVPRQIQAFVLLLPVALLDFGIGFWICGLLVFLWDNTKMRQEVQTTCDVVVSESIESNMNKANNLS
jgi:hypothetical protein